MCESRAGIKRNKTSNIPILQLHEKAEQPNLFPGRRPIIPIAEKPILQPLKIITHTIRISKLPVTHIKFRGISGISGGFS